MARLFISHSSRNNDKGIEVEDRVARPRAVCGAAIGEFGVPGESRL